MKRSKRIISVLLALVMAFSLTGPGLPLLTEQAQAVSKADIQAMKNKLASNDVKIKELEKKLNGIQGDKEKALEEKEALDEQIALINQKISELDAIIGQYNELITQKETEIADLQVREQAQYELFCDRVRAMEEQGAVSYLSILFNSSSFAEMLDSAMLVGEIMDYDNNVIETLQTTRAQLQVAKTELEEGKAEQQVMRDEQADSRAQLQVQQTKANALVKQILSQENEYKSAISAIDAEEEKIQKEIVRLSKLLEEEERKKQEQQNGGSSSAVAKGGYIWPVNSRRITSPYGGRNTGIPGASTNHKGVDIGGVGYNSNVYAAKAGTVIISKKVQSYGNYVVVSHGNGNTTLYAHLSSRKVSVGDKVKQGQVIGITGSTGISSGPHLHFEITEGGSRVDPLKYLTGYTKAW